MFNNLCPNCGKRLFCTSHAEYQKHLNICLNNTYNTYSVHPLASPEVIPADGTHQHTTSVVREFAWSAVYNANGLQSCGGFIKWPLDIEDGLTKQAWLNIEAHLRNQPGNSHLFNFRLIGLTQLGK